ncbi:lipopolysaccharide biosynthesis protein [Aquiflexum lacus]|uniref:lipopolysaccharide biosynthesis protein n=1 Tax=Aquiflexum lacus TaxID=2483805 RepID=UPI00189318A0|nr:oligosaccharide flippase family protein [Aquiflexum lacus]
MGSKLNFRFFEQLRKDKFTGDTGWLILSQFILIGSGLLVNLIIGYWYGAEQLGVFNQILGFYLILTTFFSLGINNSIIQKISTQSSKKHPEIFKSNFFITTVSTILFTGAVLLITWISPAIFSSNELAKGLFIAALSFPFFNWNKNFMAYCTGTRNQKLFANSRSLRWLVILAYILIMSLLRYPSELLYFAFLLAEISLMFFFAFKFHFLFKSALDQFQVKKNLDFGLKSFVGEIFSILNDKMDLVILGYLLSKTEIGIYSFLIFFAKSLYVFPGILQQNINPLIGKHWIDKTLDSLQNHLVKLRKINFVAVLCQAVVVLVFYKILTNNFQQEFQHTTKYLIVAIIGTFIYSLIAWGGSILVMTEKLRQNIFRTVYILIFSVISTITLSAFFHIWGAVFAVLANAVFSFWLLNGFVKRETGIRLV